MIFMLISIFIYGTYFLTLSYAQCRMLGFNKFFQTIFLIITSSCMSACLLTITPKRLYRLSLLFAWGFLNPRPSYVWIRVFLFSFQPLIIFFKTGLWLSRKSNEKINITFRVANLMFYNKIFSILFVS